MRIRSHSESHIVELDDGSKWQIFPGDLDVTLNWTPEADFTLERVADEIGTHTLISTADNSRVRVIRTGENWPVGDVTAILKDG
ncbi:hypothetical protein [Bradyrhizobium sp.]|uniref:hypothetical protein n=1 Tax=Bradyrhizobium sp. TaxID=376 RepID=UPI003C62C329